MCFVSFPHPVLTGSYAAATHTQSLLRLTISLENEKKQYMYCINLKMFSTVSAGGAIFLITGLGCIGAIAQNRCMLLIVRNFFLFRRN